jgi:multiple sugar transport system permease protein
VAQAVSIRRQPTGFRRILRDVRQQWSAYAVLTPGFILFTLFVLFAIVFAFWLSFHKWDILEPQKPYVGLENYRELIHDADLGKAIINTLFYTSTIPIALALGLLLALLLNQQIRARGFFRTVFYLPVITPLVVAALIWKWVYAGDFGLLNYYLLKAHLVHTPLLWLSSYNLAMWAVIIMSIWKGLGFIMVVYLAGLQAIPQEYYEAAEVDGASAWQKLRHITIPLLAPTTFFLVIISVIGSFQVFTQIFVMTQGGPAQRTTTIVYLIYTTAFRFFRMGYASALAYLLFGMIFVFTLLQMRYYTRRVQY